MLSVQDLAKMRSTQDEALPDTMDITRPTGTQSSIGSRIEGNNSVVAVGIKCRLTPAQMQVVTGQLARPIDVHAYTLRYELTTDLQERDVVIISDVSYEVENVKRDRSWETIQTAGLKRLA